MIGKTEFASLLSRLLGKSKAGQVIWNLEARDAFKVNISDSADIVVVMEKPSDEPDHALAQLRLNNDIAMELAAWDGDEHFTLLSSLYEDARRSYLGWDESLDQLRTALNSDNVIGKKDPSRDFPF